MTRLRDWLSRASKTPGVHHPWTGMSTAALLAAWEAGEAVWTCKMADLGPAYEQAIHEVGMALLRAMLADPFDFSIFKGRDERAAYELWQAYVSRIRALPAVRAEVERFKPEGLQINAATNVAGMFARNGYEAEMNKVPEARRIMMSRKAPQAAA